MAHTTRNIPSGKLVGCTIQQLKGYFVVQQFVRVSSGPLLAHFETDGEQLEIQLQWRLWGEIQHLSYLWTSLSELPQRLLVFWVPMANRPVPALLVIPVPSALAPGQPCLFVPPRSWKIASSVLQWKWNSRLTPTILATCS